MPCERAGALPLARKAPPRSLLALSPVLFRALFLLALLGGGRGGAFAFHILRGHPPLVVAAIMVGIDAGIAIPGGTHIVETAALVEEDRAPLFGTRPVGHRLIALARASPEIHTVAGAHIARLRAHGNKGKH